MQSWQRSEPGIIGLTSWGGKLSRNVAVSGLIGRRVVGMIGTERIASRPGVGSP